MTFLLIYPSDCQQNKVIFLSDNQYEDEGGSTLKVHMTGFLNCILVLGFFIKLKILNKMKTSSKWTNTQDVA